MDTITLVRSAVRGLLKVAGPELEGELRAVIESGDDDASPAKPQVDWDDEEARKSLIDSRAKDAYSCAALLEGRGLMSEVREAAELLASVLGQDLETAEDATFRIARRVAKDRIVSTVPKTASTANIRNNASPVRCLLIAPPRGKGQYWPVRSRTSPRTGLNP